MVNQGATGNLAKRTGALLMPLVDQRSLDLIETIFRSVKIFHGYSNKKDIEDRQLHQTRGHPRK